jgi:hypothetical protein
VHIEIVASSQASHPQCWCWCCTFSTNPWFRPLRSLSVSWVSEFGLVLHSSINSRQFYQFLGFSGLTETLGPGYRKPARFVPDYLAICGFLSFFDPKPVEDPLKTVKSPTWPASLATQRVTHFFGFDVSPISSKDTRLISEDDL